MKHAIRKAMVFLRENHEKLPSHRLLYQALREYLNALQAGDGLYSGEGEELSPEEGEKLEQEYVLEIADGGKPCFAGHPEICFSISHSGDYWACAFSPFETGLDLQENQLNIHAERIAKRFLHPDEWEWLKKSEYREFCRLWCFKESYLKYTGEGIAGGLDRFSLADLIRQADHSEKREGAGRVLERPVWQKELEAPEGYFMVITSEQPEMVTVMW